MDVETALKKGAVAGGVESAGVAKCGYEVEWNEGCYLEPLNKLAVSHRLAVEAGGDPYWGLSSADVGGVK